MSPSLGEILARGAALLREVPRGRDELAAARARVKQFRAEHPELRDPNSPTQRHISASPINASSPRPMKCQMKIAETANFGMSRSQSPRDILAAMTAINPSIIAAMKMEIRIRPSV